MCEGTTRGITVADKYCGNCGQELRGGGDFCPSCGQASRQTSQPLAQEPLSPPPQHPRQKSTWSAGRVLLLVIVAPVLLAIAWSVFQIALGFLTALFGG